jgi:hypothetical protein
MSNCGFTPTDASPLQATQTFRCFQLWESERWTAFDVYEMLISMRHSSEGMIDSLPAKPSIQYMLRMRRVSASIQGSSQPHDTHKRTFEVLMPICLLQPARPLT